MGDAIETFTVDHAPPFAGKTLPACGSPRVAGHNESLGDPVPEHRDPAARDSPSPWPGQHAQRHLQRNMIPRQRFSCGSDAAGAMIAHDRVDQYGIQAVDTGTHSPV